MSRLLAVDDDANTLFMLEKELRSDSLSIITAATGRGALALLRKGHPDTVILDAQLPDMPGLEVLDEMRRIDPRLPVIVTTGHATTETAIQAMKRGAFEYLPKPLRLPQLRDIVAKALALGRARHVPAVVAEDGTAPPAVDAIVGCCAAMQEVYKAVGRFAEQDVPVLLLGESGTGKELVARAIYQHSARSQASFLEINSAAIPETLLESELFGHEQGAFTGAERRRLGKFEQADGGTIFLDEIGDMSGATQAKVLRLLQEQRFERVGGNETVHTDVRVLAATNHDLQTLVAQGHFRRDVLYRLNAFAIHLPPLRERGGDLPLLVDYFRKRLNRELGKGVQSVTAEAMALLTAYPWPGNVRELENAVKYALIHAPGGVLTADCLPTYVRGGTSIPEVRPPASGSAPAEIGSLVHALLQAGERDIYAKAGRAFDCVVLKAVLDHVHGNQVRASELLGMSRTTLRHKLRILGMGT